MPQRSIHQGRRVALLIFTLRFYLPLYLMGVKAQEPPASPDNHFKIYKRSNSIKVEASPASSFIRETVEKLNKVQTRNQAEKEVEGLGKAAVPELLKFMHDKSKEPDGRGSAHALIGKLKATEHRAALEKCLLEDADYKDRQGAAIGLGMLGERASIPALKKALSDMGGQVKLCALWAMVKLGEVSHIDIAVRAITGKVASDQHLAMEILSLTRDQRVVNQLTPYLKSNDYWTGAMVKLTISRSQLIGLSLETTLQRLASMLAEPEYEIQIWAAIHLAEIGSPEAIEILIAQAPKSRGAAKGLMLLVQQGKVDASRVHKALKRR